MADWPWHFLWFLDYFSMRWIWHFVTLSNKLPHRFSVVRCSFALLLLIKEKSSISKSPQSYNMVSFVDCMQACVFRLAGFIFSACFEVVSGCKAQTGCRLDWDSNCHFESDKVLICPPGTERLDITVDKWAVEQNWQDAREDKMPSAIVFFPPICYHSWTTAS